MTILSSLQNPTVKDLVRLRQRRHRDRAGVVLIEGLRELSRAVAAGYVPDQLYICPELYADGATPGLVSDLDASGVPLATTTVPVFQKIAYREHPDGVLAVGPQVGRALADLPDGSPDLLIVAEAIEKPGNLGTMLRTADAAGATGLILTDPTTDLNNPNVVRASQGALFSVPCAEAGNQETFDFLRTRGGRTVVATPDADTVYWDADLSGNLAIVAGPEAAGVSRFWREHADVLVSIPMSGQADSLNVATATALVLYEALRQRRS